MAGRKRFGMQQTSERLEIRNPKHEIRNKSKTPMTEIQNGSDDGAMRLQVFGGGELA